MKEFMNKNFLLNTKTAETLYHDYAAKMPIIDYHSHLSPEQIYKNEPFKNITHAWLGPGDRTGDHYKWKAMRSIGINEELISGNMNDMEKFKAYCKLMPKLIGNPLYHWSHLELRRIFGINEIINEKNSNVIWEKANKIIQNLTPLDILKKCNVKVVCTTDDPIDDLKYHILIKNDSKFKDIKVLPSFRPDKAVDIESDDFENWILKLEKVVNFKINNIDDLLNALEKRVEFFASVGCKISDHGMGKVYFKNATKSEADYVFLKKKSKQLLIDIDLDIYKGYILTFLAGQYVKYDIAQQYHIGPMRNNSKIKFNELGPDTGFDAMDDSNFIEKLSKLLSNLEENNVLPKTILYCLNPKDNYPLTVLSGCFVKENIKGYVQVGTAWWFLDQLDGMRKNIETIMQVSNISNSVGMLTDSRSFMSPPRHEYYRRLICSMFGDLVESGQYPIEEISTLGEIVENICFNNINNYLNLNIDNE